MKKYLLALLVAAAFGLAACRAQKETTRTETIDTLTVKGTQLNLDIPAVSPAADSCEADSIASLVPLTPKQKEVIKKAIRKSLKKRPKLTKPVTVDTLGVKFTLKPTADGFRAEISTADQKVPYVKTITETNITKPKQGAPTWMWLLGLILLLVLFILSRLK